MIAELQDGTKITVSTIDELVVELKSLGIDNPVLLIAQETADDLTLKGVICKVKK